MPPPCSNDIEITNYDVLADQVSNPINSDESDIGLSLAAHSYHVGNNRLEVLCNIHNQAFSEHQAKGDETNSAAIVEKIMNIVQNQCVPKGRFLERSSKGEWSVVDTSKARSLVKQALMKTTQGSFSSAGTAAGASQEEIKKKEQDDAEKKRRRRSSLLRRSVSSSMLPNLMKAGREFELTSFDDKKKASRQGSILRPGDLSSPNSPLASPNNSPKISPKNSPVNSRSNSPIPPSSGHRRGIRGKSDAEKKIQLPDQHKPRPAFGRSHSVELGQGRSTRRFATKYTGPEIVKETLKMDVLLNTGKTSLLPGADLHGNNRLRVMVNIQTMTYQNAKDDEAKDKMAEELVNTIEKFWGGRVLSIIPSMRRKGGDDEQYIKLESIHSVQAMRNLLSGKAAEKEEAITQGTAPDPKIPQGRRASLKAIESIAAAGVGVGTGDAKTIMPSTLPTLPPDMQHLRSAAVKSLQKRKVRQGLNSRIRGLTADKAAIYQDGSTSASVMSSANSSSVGNMAAIPTQIVSRASSTASGGQSIPQMQHYRQTSSGASVGSSVGGMSTGPPAMVQRQGSVCSTASTVATSMSMSAMNAARNMANINLNANPSPLLSSTVVNPNGMMGGPMLGSELHIPNNNVPNNIMAPMLQQQQQQSQAQHARMSQMSQQMQQNARQIQQSQAQHARMSQMSQQMQQNAQQIQQSQERARMSQMSQQMQQNAQQIQQQQMMQQQMQMQQQLQMQQQMNQQQFQPRQITMPSVPEEQFNNNNNDNNNFSDATPLTFEQLQQLAQLGNQQHEPQFNQQSLQNNGGMGGFQGQQQQQLQDDGGFLNGRQDRNSLLNSTGSDGLPKFGQNEMEMLIKGLEE